MYAFLDPAITWNFCGEAIAHVPTHTCNSVLLDKTLAQFYPCWYSQCCVSSIENLPLNCRSQLKRAPYLSVMQSAYELGQPVSDVSTAKDSSYESFNTVDRDRADLLRLGKKQVLKAWDSNVRR